MPPPYIRSRSLLNWTGAFLCVVLLVLLCSLWLNNEAQREDYSQPVPSLENPSENIQEVKYSGGSRIFNPSLTCFDRYPLSRREQRGDYWVLYNYVRPTQNVSCDESITYTTHGDYTFNDNLLPLLRRWRGPVSLAIYAPGWDFFNSIKSIFYYRNCVNSTLVKEFLSFHLYFDIRHLPRREQKADVPIRDFETESKGFTCEAIREDLQSNASLYKQVKGLNYPVNVGRNIARLEAATHFIFPSDVELYPSPGLIPDFLSMIRRNEDPALHRDNPRVFVNSIFEVKKDILKIPESKAELLAALDSGDAIPFHQKVCSLCHSIPNSTEWMDKSHIQDKMSIFHTAKRVSPFQHWEPIYIGTHEDPLYDERLSWEGRSDKMTQGYQLCLKDYDFHILNNAFLIHRPGIKVLNKNSKKKVAQITRQNSFIRLNISKEIDVLYGTREGCRLY
eukprot:TRINITY_DN7848_c0_g1_i1.p1 TRINITY_DN7848_c0_g1~~TRINITY_DN7848_c0_g1_i1.p1  ORF type:complete len:448 (-),score=121.69 TRINITY_DN7848_c0_g1_i1:197-1540(-)